MYWYCYYRVAQKSLNLKYSVICTGISIIKFATQFVERYHSVVSRELNMEDFISNSCQKVTNFKRILVYIILTS